MGRLARQPAGRRGSRSYLIRSSGDRHGQQYSRFWATSPSRSRLLMPPSTPSTSLPPPCEVSIPSRSPRSSVRSGASILRRAYPQLTPMTREWYANAPVMLSSLRTQWPLLPPWQRSSLLDQWAYELPQMLWMLEPVLAQAQAIETRANIVSGLAALRQQASQPPSHQGVAHGQARLETTSNRSQMTTMLESYSSQMATSTTNLMR